MLKTEADYSYLGEPTTAMKLRKWGLIAVLVLYGVLLIVLLALYGSVNNDDDDASCQNGAIGSFTSAVSFTASQVGFAASLSSSGSLQLGAGTTIYKDLYVKDSVCPKMPDIEPVFDSSFVLTYIDGERDSSTVSILKSNNARDMQLQFSADYDKQLADICTLDSTGGLLVGIVQDVSLEEDEAVVVPLLVNEIDETISFGTEVVYGGVYSVSPLITPLSKSSFAITYLDNVTTVEGAWQYSALTRYGVVNADRSITLSAPVIFAADDNYELQYRVEGLDEKSYLLVTNSASEKSSEGYAYGPLEARVATVEIGSEGSSVTLGSNHVLSSNLAAFNMGSAHVDSSTVLVAYSDYTHNFGISAISLKVSSDSVVSVGAAISLTSGQALTKAQNGLQMDLDLAVFGGNQFVITYHDVTNQGAFTLVLGELTESGELGRKSPDLLLTRNASDAEAVYQWHGVAAGESSEAYNAEIAVVSAQQGSDCDLATSGLSVSTTHVLPPAFGVVHAASQKEKSGNFKTNTQLSGWIGGYTELTPGMLYYTNTFGELSSAGIYFGQQGTDHYVDDTASASLMTGLVGVAVSENTIMLMV